MKKTAFVSIVCLSFVLIACKSKPTAPVSASGVGKATVKVPTGSDGLTAEQRNIARRLKADNQPGSIKHLYIVSAYSGQVILYSTVDGKVSSSGKRLTPKTVNGGYDSGDNGWYGGFSVDIGNATKTTNEVLQDDGTYGDSGEYLFWFDTSGNYYQYYVTGGSIPLVTTKPFSPKSVVINVEQSGPAGESPVPPPAPLPQ